VESFDPAEASELLQAYSGRLAFVGGRSDELVTPDVMEASARAFPDSELRWIDECGHYPHREKRGDLVDVLAELTRPPAAS
jgi:pimeloyl-ACP methyl ester carboxylesterase